MSDPVKVACQNCKWRGKRVYRTECYAGAYCWDSSTGCTCPRYGRCPKCNARLQSVADLKRWAEADELLKISGDASQ